MSMIKENQHSRAHRFSLCALSGEGHHLLDLLAVKTLMKGFSPGENGSSIYEMASSDFA